jgi:hypothetical protein
VPAKIYAGSGSTEPLVTVAGHQWVTRANTAVGEGQLSQLAALPGGRAIWLGNSQYPIEISANDGRTWRYVATPPPPGSSGYPAPFRLLPNGTLLAQDPKSGHDYELSLGATQWTKIPRRLALPGATATIVAGGQVVWVDATAHSGPPAKVLVVPVSRY